MSRRWKSLMRKKPLISQKEISEIVEKAYKAIEAINEPMSKEEVQWKLDAWFRETFLYGSGIVSSGPLAICRTDEGEFEVYIIVHRGTLKKRVSKED